MAKSKTSKGKSRSNDLKISKCHRAFEGTVFRCNHYSESLGLDARFSVYVPDAPGIQTTLPYPHGCEELPVLLFLSDAGCSDLEILMQGNVLQHCSDCGLILVSADTTPRSEADRSIINPSYYVNATLSPWDKHCRMLDYLERDLLDIVHDNFPTCGHDAVSIMGHGIGGTSALTMAFRNEAGVPFRSVSALAPLLNPMSTDVTKKLSTSKLQNVLCKINMNAFQTLLGEDESAWRNYDPMACVVDSVESAPPILLDVGSEEGSNYVQEMVKPFDFLSACHQHGIQVDFRLRSGFDHGFFFVASVMEEHIDFHSKYLDA
eukprot:Skav232251  [mRNA]  locus=scaffold273:113267:115303:- [translate_table: standard]